MDLVPSDHLKRAGRLSDLVILTCRSSDNEIVYDFPTELQGKGHIVFLYSFSCCALVLDRTGLGEGSFPKTDGVMCIDAQ